MRILFTGYAPVHFVCFKPIYEALAGRPDVDVRVSGGLRTKRPEGGYDYDADAMYARFGLAPGSVLTVEEIRELDIDLLMCANTNRIEPRSAGRTIEIFHGVSFRNRAIRPANSGHDHYFLVGPYMRRRFEERGILQPGDSRAVEIGFPKTDRLLDGTLERDRVVREHGLSGTRPVVLYAPTGAKMNSLETVGEELIRALRNAGPFDLLVKPHDHPKNAIDWFERLAGLEDEHLRLVRAPDVIPSLFASDLLVTDASSVANEYTLLDRPIVFIDVPELLAAAGGEGSALDLETWGRRGGVIARDPAEAVDAVSACLKNPGTGSPVRRAIAADLFYHPGLATDAAVRWLSDELGIGAKAALAGAPEALLR
jgi:CDP-glycerol:poly(glycerophosphate) glycerophosphotransferase